MLPCVVLRRRQPIYDDFLAPHGCLGLMLDRLPFGKAYLFDKLQTFSTTTTSSTTGMMVVSPSCLTGRGAPTRRSIGTRSIFTERQQGPSLESGGGLRSSAGSVGRDAAVTFGLDS